MSTQGARGMFRHGELHLVVLALLERQAMHGYQLMGELNRLFGPRYKASPGSVYPRIEALAGAELIDGRDEGGRRVYAITPAGSEALSRRLHELVAVEARTGVRLGGGRAEDCLDRFTARVRAVAPRVELGALNAVLDDAATRLEQLGTDAERNIPDTTTRRIS